MAKLSAIYAGVDGLDSPRSEGERLGVVESPFDLDAIRSENWFSLFDEGLYFFVCEAVPDFEFPGIGGDRCVHRVGIGQGPVPQILILDITKQIRDGLIRMEMVPGQHGTRMAEVEMQQVAFGLELIDES